MTDSFSQAIVRSPGPEIVDGIRSGPQAPDYQRACQQHAAYVQALEDCGLTVTQMPALPGFPDCGHSW